MPKIRFIKTKIFLGVIASLLAGGLVFVIFIVEKRKDVIKGRSDREVAQLDAQAYKDEYLGSIQQLKEEYVVSMEAAKQEYESLLAQQSEIVAQHTKTIQVGTAPTGSSAVSAPATKTVTVQKKVAKPSSKRSTKKS